MSGILDEAARVLAPKQGKTFVTTTATAAASIDFGTLDTSGDGTGYWTFIAETTAAYITFNSNATITDPDGTTVAGNGRTFLFPANQHVNLYLDAGAVFAETVAVSSTGKLRYYKSGE